MTNEDIVRFCRQSINGFSKNFNILITGSISDLPLLYYLENSSDVDILSWHNDIHISPEDTPIPTQFTGQFYKLEICNSPAGFTKVIAYHNDGKWTYCGKKSRIAEPNHGPAFTKALLPDHHKLTSDLVLGLRYSVWPSNATEWNVRRRNSGWPSNEIIRQIVNDGCHLVLKPHPSHPDDENEWRFSFSLAESTLAHEWNDGQQYIYRTLRLIKNNIVEQAGGDDQTILRTYHFKTLLFWACEEQPSWFWEETRIETAVKELLGRMIEWLIEKRCPNYFIPSCNLFDCQLVNSQTEIDLLLSYVQDRTLNLPRQLQIKSSFRFDVRQNLLLVLQMCFNCMNFVNPLKPEEVMSSLDRLARSPLLTEEIQWIYKAISSHRDIYSDSCNGDVIQEAIRCFSLAKENDMERNSCLMSIRLYDTVYGIIFDYGFIKAKCTNGNDNEYLEGKSKPSLLDEHEFALDILNGVDILNHHFIRPSYFLRAAYEANFHYSVMQDYHLAKQICDDALEVLHKQKYVEVFYLGAEWGRFCSDCFSIVITDKWIRLFDEAIVATTGFLTLYNLVRTTIGKLTATLKTIVYFRDLGCLIGPKEKLLIRINPIHFLRYIRLQCSKLMGEPQSSFCIDSNDFLTVCVNVSYRMNAPRNVSEMITKN